MLGLSLLYALGRGVPAIDGALFGIKAAVLVIVLEALIRIGRRALKTQLLIGLSLLAFVGIFFFALPFPLIVVAGGVDRLSCGEIRSGTARACGHGRDRNAIAHQSLAAIRHRGPGRADRVVGADRARSRNAGHGPRVGEHRDVLLLSLRW